MFAVRALRRGYCYFRKDEIIFFFFFRSISAIGEGRRDCYCQDVKTFSLYLAGFAFILTGSVVDSDPEPDPDPNRHENQDPDPNKVGSDPQHCLQAPIAWSNFFLTCVS